MISNKMGILERRVEYFNEFLNNQNVVELKVSSVEVDGQMLPLATMEETVRAIHRLKNISHYEPMELQPNWLNMEATNYTMRFIN